MTLKEIQLGVEFLTTSIDFGLTETQEEMMSYFFKMCFHGCFLMAVSYHQKPPQVNKNRLWDWYRFHNPNFCKLLLTLTVYYIFFSSQQTLSFLLLIVQASLCFNTCYTVPSFEVFSMACKSSMSCSI